MELGIHVCLKKNLENFFKEKFFYEEIFIFLLHEGKEMSCLINDFILHVELDDNFCEVFMEGFNHCLRAALLFVNFIYKLINYRFYIITERIKFFRSSVDLNCKRIFLENYTSLVELVKEEISSVTDYFVLFIAFSQNCTKFLLKKKLKKKIT